MVYTLIFDAAPPPQNCNTVSFCVKVLVSVCHCEDIGKGGDKSTLLQSPRAMDRLVLFSQEDTSTRGKGDELGQRVPHKAHFFTVENLHKRRREVETGAIKVKSWPPVLDACGISGSLNTQSSYIYTFPQPYTLSVQGSGHRSRTVKERYPVFCEPLNEEWAELHLLHTPCIWSNPQQVSIHVSYACSQTMEPMEELQPPPTPQYIFNIFKGNVLQQKKQRQILSVVVPAWKTYAQVKLQQRSVHHGALCSWPVAHFCITCKWTHITVSYLKHITRCFLLCRSTAREVQKRGELLRMQTSFQCMRRLVMAHRMLTVSAAIQISHRMSLAMVHILAWKGELSRMWFIRSWRAWKMYAVRRLQWSVQVAAYSISRTMNAKATMFTLWRKGAKAGKESEHIKMLESRMNCE